MNEPVIPIETNTTKHPSALAVLTLAAVLVVLVFTALSYPAIVDSRNAAQGVREQALVTACRGKYRADIDDASAAVSSASAHLDLLTSEAFEAVLTEDIARLAGLQDGVHKARDELTTALDELDTANHAYRTALTQSSEDQDAFLASCK